MNDRAARSRSRFARRFAPIIDTLESRLVPSTVTTSKPDYAPGEVATIYANGYALGEGVRFEVAHLDTIYANTYPSWVVVDGSADDLDGALDGNVETTWQVGMIPGSELSLVATGEASGLVASTTFTDASTFTGFTLTTGQSPNPVIAGNSATYVFTATRTGNGGLNITISASSLPSGATLGTVTPNPINFSGNTPTSNTASVTINTTAGMAAGSYTFTVTGTGSDGQVRSVTNIPLVVNKATSLAITTAPHTTTVGVSTGTITVELRDALGSPIVAPSGGTVVSLSSSSGGGTFRDAGDTTTITSVTIPAGSTTASLRYRDSNAGSPTITAAASGLTSGTQAQTINKATPAFSGLSAPTIVYGTANTTISGTILGNGLAPSGSVAVTINGVTQNAAITAGTGAFSTSFVTGTLGVGASPYTISYVYAGDANFTSASNTSNSLTVTPKALTITANPASKTYGDVLTFAGTEFTPSGLVNSDTVDLVDLTSAGADATATVAGAPYAIVASNAVGTGLGNYTISYVDGQLSVNQRALTITADDQTKVYGGTFTFAGTEFGTSGLVNGDTVDLVDLTSAGADATATVSGSPYAIAASNATGSGLGNYAISYVDGNLDVTPKALTVTASDQTKVYGDTFTFAGTEFTTSGLVNGDTVDLVDLTSAGADATATVSGSPYAIAASNASGSGLDNYAISYVDGNLDVTPKALTVTADDQTKVYGDTFAFAGTEFTTSGLVNGDTVDLVDLTSAGASATATVSGSPYDIVASNASGSGLGNYAITYVDGNLDVTPKALTVTADDQTKVYGDTFGFAGSEFTTSGLINGDSVDLVDLTSLGAAATATVSGSPYAIVGSNATGTGLDNYDITYVEGDLDVTPKALTVTADDQTKVYGDTFTFAGAEFTTSGLINGDSVDLVDLTSLGAAATATVGGSPYDIIVSNASGSGLDNYDITYVDGELTVDLRTLTITADDQTKAYGTVFLFVGPLFTTSGLVNGDTVDAVDLASTGAAATATVSGSPYAIVASNATGTGLDNYDITYANGELDVTPTNLTVTANGQTKIYGDVFSFTGLEFAVSGLVNSDTVDTVTLTSPGAAATANVGGSPYAIVPSNAVGTGLGNYTITYVDGELDVTQRNLTVSGITANDKIVDGNTLATLNLGAATLVGVVNSDPVSLNTASAVGTFSDALVGNGKTVSVSGLTLVDANGNYTLTQPTTTASILPAINPNVVVDGTGIDDTLVLTPTPGNGSITYVLNGGTPVVLTGVTSFRFNGLAGTDRMTVVLPSGTGIDIPGLITFDGGSGTDTLVFDAAGQPVRTRPGTLFGVQQQVDYLGVEATNVNNAQTVASFYGPNTAARSTAFASLTANQRWVQALYLNALGRAGSTTELNFWVAILVGPGGSRQGVANAIERSLEARMRLVDGWYKTYLGRTGSVAEIQPWANALVAGATEEQVLSNLLGSAEFLSRAQSLVPSGTANERFVTALYQTLLNRTPSPAEIAGYVAFANAGQRTQVAQLLLTSAEYRSYQIDAYYVSLLRRPSDAAGRNAWASTTFDFTSIRLQFAASAEYYVNG